MVWSIVSIGFAKGGCAVGLGYSFGRIAVNRFGRQFLQVLPKEEPPAFTWPTASVTRAPPGQLERQHKAEPVGPHWAGVI